MADMPQLPDDLRDDLLKEALYVFETQNDNKILYHRRFENEDETSLNYIDKKDMSFYDKSGGVSCLAMNPDLEKRVFEFFNQANHPITNQFEYYGFLYVEGGPYCAPHIDDLNRRRNGFQMLLTAGGNDVRTNWWEPKEENKDMSIIDYSAIPYNKLDLACDERLEENTWYWMKFDSIHSVEKLESIRIFLAGGIVGVGDMRYLIDSQ
jgi:hypothetical protein